MKKSNRNALPIILVVIALVIVGFFLLQAKNNNDEGLKSLLNTNKTTDVAKDTKKDEVTKENGMKKITDVNGGNSKTNFSREGNLVDARGTMGGWALLYETPTSPAIQVILNFTQDSLCDFGEENKTCNEENFQRGTRVSVIGVEKDNEVTVTEMKELK